MEQVRARYESASFPLETFPRFAREELLGEAGRNKGFHLVTRSVLQSGLLVGLTTITLPLCAISQVAASGSRALAIGSLSGVVRDVDGVPQMGALVEALLPDSSLVASATTDAKGQYRILLRPGSYRVRATAALLLPALRERLKVAQGTRSVVNLTLTTILAPAGWLPASKRTSSEPGDDWMWTLRSSASRSILRYAGTSSDLSDGSLAVSTSRKEPRSGESAGSVTLKESDGGFALGGNHTVLVLTHHNEDDSGAVLRADLSGSRSPYPVAPSAEISVGMQRRTLLNGRSRAVLTFSSHPELVSNGRTGLQGLTVRSAQRVDVGDLIRIDVGSVLRSGNLGGNATTVEPFLRVAARPNDDVEMAYTYTRSRGTESLDDLDRVQASLPIVFHVNGRARLESGSHHAVSVRGKLPGGAIAEVAAFQDQRLNPAIAGAGTLSEVDLRSGELVADPTTRTFRVVARSYNSSGLRMSVRQPLGKSLQAGAEVATGSALTVPGAASASLDSTLNSVRPAKSLSATAYIDGKVLSTGTVLRASYRWQPRRTLTSVDGFRVSDESAYLSCSLRQSLGKVRLLPHGFEAVVDLRNLLSEGYQPFLSGDGSTLYLAQTPRTMQAGLSFSF